MKCGKGVSVKPERGGGSETGGSDARNRRGRILDPPLLGRWWQGFIVINLHEIEFRGTGLKKPLVPVAASGYFALFGLGRQDED